MNTRVRRLRSAALALALAGLLDACGGGGGGASGPVQLFFGTNGQGACNSVVTSVNLRAASAVVATDGRDAVHCALNTVLASEGCNAGFVEIGGGELRVTISGCTIPAVTNLFQCVFEKVDISALEGVTDAQCACHANACDEDPPVCVNEGPTPGACEDCSNGRDDDGNGFVDCADPNCEHTRACAPATSSTSTTQTTSDTTPTSTSVTTTTINPPIQAFTLTFGLQDAANIGSLQWDTHYAAAPVRSRSASSQPQCSSLVDGAVSSFSYDDAEQTLHASMSGLSGTAGPLELAECTFVADTLPTADDFSIVVLEAMDPDQKVIAPPQVVVQDIVGIGVTTTTMTSDTTTTTATTTTVRATTTTTLPAGPLYLVTFRLESANTALGALQLATDYAAAPGNFQGSGALVECTNKLSGALFAPNDDDTSRKLRLGLISLVPFGAPADLVECQFLGSLADPPAPGDFPVTIEDVTDGNGAPATATIAVTVTP